MVVRVSSVGRNLLSGRGDLAKFLLYVSDGRRSAMPPTVVVYGTVSMGHANLTPDLRTLGSL
jgi:hypothetical protein